MLCASLWWLNVICKCIAIATLSDRSIWYIYFILDNMYMICITDIFIIYNCVLQLSYWFRACNDCWQIAWVIDHEHRPANGILPLRPVAWSIAQEGHPCLALTSFRRLRTKKLQEDSWLHLRKGLNSSKFILNSMASRVVGLASAQSCPAAWACFVLLQPMAAWMPSAEDGLGPEAAASTI